WPCCRPPTACWARCSFHGGGRRPGPSPSGEFPLDTFALDTFLRRVFPVSREGTRSASTAANSNRMHMDSYVPPKPDNRAAVEGELLTDDQRRGPEIWLDKQSL